jgi:uncharacterized RDD family membrane protein YckC/Tfp pilus assembly major pilin PilA
MSADPHSVPSAAPTSAPTVAPPSPSGDQFSRQPAATPIFAGFWRRVAAYLLDNLIVLIPMIVVVVILDSEGWASLAQFVIWWVYKAGMESSAVQATLGKKAMGIKVCDMEGQRVSFARATGRFFASLISALLLCIGYIMAGFTTKRQALHDLIASTLVVNARATQSQIPAGAGTMPMTAGVWVAVVLILVLPFGIGMIAAISIPAYQDYAARAKMAEAIMDGVRLKADAAAAISAYEQSKDKSSEGDVRQIDPTSKYVKQLSIQKPQRTIAIILDSSRFSVRGIEPNAYIHLFSSKDGASWTCTAVGVANKYLPATCRQ